MSSSAVSQPTHVSVLRELLAAEKENIRVWLRAEMDRLMDPILDSIFNRLETKLTNGLERTQSIVAGQGALVVNSSFIKQTAPFIAQPSTSTFTSSLHPPLSYFNPQHANINFSPPNLFNPHCPGLFPVPPPPVSITQITFPNQLTNVQSRPMSIKHEIEATANEPKGQSRQSLSALAVNEQSNQYNWDEEECDCDECVFGIEITDEDEDGEDCDSVQWIEDHEELSPPTKKPKIDQTQPNNAQAEVMGESSRQSAGELQLDAQPNQTNKQFITVHLKCLLSNCLDTFPEEHLNQHMLQKHDIGPLRCLVKDCGHSFAKQFILTDHLKQVHQNTTQWYCDKCSNHFSTYKLLSDHNIKQHHLGHFQCSYSSCTFTGDYRKKMYNHYAKQHNPTLNCQYADCNYQTSILARLKKHEQIHSDIKPYRCKWPMCEYSAVRQSDTINHIRRHFARHSSSPTNGTLVDPKDYLEVVNEL